MSLDDSRIDLPGLDEGNPEHRRPEEGTPDRGPVNGRERTPLEPRTRLPIDSRELLTGLAKGRTLELERRHGNADLTTILELLGVAGPFTTISPWELEDESGHRLLHAGGYAALPFGERFGPLLDYLTQFLHETNGTGLGHHLSAARAVLETNLVALLAGEAPSHGDSRVIFSNSGAEAVDAALKLVRTARPKAKRLLTFERGFHGKTFGALSVTPNEEFQAPFRPLLPDVEVLPYGDVEALERAIVAVGPDNVAGVILEPVQGEGGVIRPPPGFLPALQALKERHGFVVVADEIQTGLGRCGHWFASVAGGLDPDVITLAKPLGGGLLAIGATIARNHLVQAMLPGLKAKRHYSTFAGNTLAMAVGIRSLELLVEGDLAARARELGARGLARLQRIQAANPGFIAEVRGAGMLFALKLRRTLKPALLAGNADMAHQLGTALAMRALHLGGVHVCYSLNASRVMRLTPALNMPEELFEQMFDRIERVAERNPQAWQMLPKMPLQKLARLAGVSLRKG